MSRPRHVWSLLGVVLAVLLGCAAPAAASTSARPVQAGATVPAAAHGPAGVPAPSTDSSPARLHPAVFTGTGGPACAPAAPERGGTPAVPARAWGEHAQVPPARAAPEETGPTAARPARILVRGPDRPAPDRLELCVLRI
ncbi:hypothetical protein [Streptomyces avidinii]|uniref:Uncharacterized protein n=1 Tax=Streptomyces avidinii TaxID=1895 RepID=A0ABS4LBW5_STRAV|nr:hypothetical protein [Streptomyces avidinii]MBP2039607.1 hypothetical protein [Streptomyces avidinii]GGZ20046.1 hypothetical protein GCM10010343_54180 [Streptomyces avidinii]